MTEQSQSRSLAHRWLLLIPFLWQVAMVPFINDITWRPLSLPFAMAWQMVGVLVTSAVIGIVFLIDRKQEPADPDENVDTKGDVH